MTGKDCLTQRDGKFTVILYLGDFRANYNNDTSYNLNLLLCTLICKQIEKSTEYIEKGKLILYSEVRSNFIT
jgi:hypothetical protein